MRRRGAGLVHLAPQDLSGPVRRVPPPLPAAPAHRDAAGRALPGLARLGFVHPAPSGLVHLAPVRRDPAGQDPVRRDPADLAPAHLDPVVPAARPPAHPGPGGSARRDAVDRVHVPASRGHRGPAEQVRSDRLRVPVPAQPEPAAPGRSARSQRIADPVDPDLAALVHRGRPPEPAPVRRLPGPAAPVHRNRSSAPVPVRRPRGRAGNRQRQRPRRVPRHRLPRPLRRRGPSVLRPPVRPGPAIPERRACPGPAHRPDRPEPQDASSRSARLPAAWREASRWPPDRVSESAGSWWRRRTDSISRERLVELRFSCPAP